MKKSNCLRVLTCGFISIIFFQAGFVFAGCEERSESDISEEVLGLKSQQGIYYQEGLNKNIVDLLVESTRSDNTKGEYVYFTVVEEDPKLILIPRGDAPDVIKSLSNQFNIVHPSVDGEYSFDGNKAVLEILLEKPLLNFNKLNPKDMPVQCIACCVKNDEACCDSCSNS